MFRRVPLARHNLFADRRRLIASVIGVGVAISLIFLFEGLWNGLLTQVGAYSDNIGADLFIGDPENRGLAGDPSVIPLSSVEQVRNITGVQSADSVILRGSVIKLHDKRIYAGLVGSNPGAAGGPWKMAKGRSVSTDDEIVVDQSLARQHGLSLHRRIEVSGTSFRIVGLSADTRTWMSTYLFVTHSAAQELMRSEETTSFVLVGTKDPESVARIIRSTMGLSALTPEQIGVNDRRLITGIMGAPINLMVGIAFVAGTLIVALTVYSMIVERNREYGIVKAMGATGRRIHILVLGQTLALSFLGGLAGFLLYLGASRLVSALRPQFWVRLTPGIVAEVVVAIAAMALLAAILPTSRITRLDPASVYRG